METWNPNSGRYESHDALGIGASGVLNQELSHRRQEEVQKRREEEERRRKEEEKRRRGY